MRVAALAGGVGAGKFLRGLARALGPENVTAIVNTGDDIVVHGLHVSPDLDSVVYWLAGAMDRERGWGRAGETFRATGELRALRAPRAWFGLGDLDLAIHLRRSELLAGGAPLSSVTEEICRAFGVLATVLPMTDDPVTTRMDAVDEAGLSLDLHFQEYWVLRGARDEVKAVRFEGTDTAQPAPGVLDAIGRADAVLLCPSNPVASIDPILAVPGVADAVSDRREVTAGVSPIVGGAPLRGMADRLLPVRGVEVSAAGVGAYYAGRGLLRAWVIDDVDRAQAERVEALGLRVSVTGTVMSDDAASERLAWVALAAARPDALR